MLKISQASEVSRDSKVSKVCKVSRDFKVSKDSLALKLLKGSKDPKYFHLKLNQSYSCSIFTKIFLEVPLTTVIREYLCWIMADK